MDKKVFKHVTLSCIVFATLTTEVFVSGDVEELGNWARKIPMNRLTDEKDFRRELTLVPALYSLTIPMKTSNLSTISYKFIRREYKGEDFIWESNHSTESGNRSLTFDAAMVRTQWNDHLEPDITLGRHHISDDKLCAPPVHFREGGLVTEPYQTTTYFRQVVKAGLLDYHEVNDQILLGSSPRSPSHLKQLKDEGITMIVNLQTEDDIKRHGPCHASEANTLYDYKLTIKNAGIALLWIPTEDMCSNGRAEMVADAAFLIQAHLVESSNKVYIHCNAGVGRSTAATAAYLTFCCGMSLEDVHRTVVRKRPVIYFDKGSYMAGHDAFKRKYLEASTILGNVLSA